MNLDINRLGETREAVRRLCDEETGSKIGPIWGLNEEGEINGAWRDIGVPNMWYMMGMSLPSLLKLEVRPLRMK